MSYEKDKVNAHITAALNNLQSCKQLNSVKEAIDNIVKIQQVINDKDTVLAHNMNCYVEPQKKPIDLFSDDELLKEIQKRLNRYVGPARAYK